MSNPTTTYISSTDLEERLEAWRSIATMFRDRHESLLIHGQIIPARAVDFGSDALEQCIGDIERLLSDARGEEVEEKEDDGNDDEGKDMVSL